MTTEITVRGTFSAFQPPERATVHAAISYEGATMQPVYDRVAHDLETVRASVVRLEEAGAVTWWSAQQLRTWSQRPPNAEGKVLPPVHHASVTLEVKFRDFAELSRWIGEHIAATTGFRVSRVEWALTVEHRDRLRMQVREQAVHDAVSRAQQYADALGLGTIRPIAVADAGMLGVDAPSHGGPGTAFIRAAAAPGGASPDVELQPEDITVSVAVDARFVAGDT